MVPALSGTGSRQNITATGRSEQLPYRVIARKELGLPADVSKLLPAPASSQEILNRRIPDTTLSSEWASPSLKAKSVYLPEANTLSDSSLRQLRFGRVRRADGSIELFVPEVILIQFQDAKQVAALRVEPMREVEAVAALAHRKDVRFVELNVLQQRQFVPNDSQVSSQWHHAVIGSFQAWEHGLGDSVVRVAIVDTPFQMSHPDLSANVVPGWSVISNATIAASSGIDHSTLGAGLAAAVVNNGLGVAGAANCQVLPIHINGFTSEMYDAIIWAADHGVRVVNVSWSGADSPTLNEAGLYLKEHARGLLAMAGVNGSGPLNYPNQPHIYGISMTDAADNLQSHSGQHIDFAAPGLGLFSTTIGSTYAGASGTSFATPLFCGVVAALFSINPTLSPDEVVELLKNTADDRAQPGWDPFFGWGRIHFGNAAAAAKATLPTILSVAWDGGEVTVSANYGGGLDYSLWKTSGVHPPNWSLVTNARVNIEANVIHLSDPTPDRSTALYRLRARVAGVSGE